MRLPALVLVLPLLASVGAAQTTPAIDDLISLKRVGSPAISPDGHSVAYTVRETNWDENAYETEIWVADVPSGATHQLTSAKGSSNAPAWSPDGRWLAFGSDRAEKRQIYLIDPRAGEAQVLTSSEEGVVDFAWSPDGKQIAYTANDPKPQALKDRDKKYGEFEMVDQDQVMTHLYAIDIAAKKAVRLTTGPFVVGSFAWSPNGTAIAFDHRINSDPSNSGTADISIVTVSDQNIRKLVSQEGPDSRPLWSPDGSQIVFESALANPDYYSYTNSVLAVVPSGGGTIQPISKEFDESPSLIVWSPAGIFFSASSRTWAYLYGLDPMTRKVTRYASATEWIGSGFSFSKDFSTVAFVGSDARTFPEVFAAPLKTMAAKRLSDLGAQVAAWPKSTDEVISWKSQDGAAIEGVLHKPADFQAGRRYPLLVVIHGGPTGVSRPVPYASATSYPIDLWLAKGAIVLEPNYRGSAGYGEKFRSLNIRNLGIGDAWDVISGVDALVSQGLADNDRIGVMGWSQGGYISAFLTTHDSARSRRCRSARGSPTG
jgi:dipeptidyl aminopeptidase/acylaminoacyl peptidase